MKIGRVNIISLLITALVGAIFLILAFETWALFTGNKPITVYVREAVHDFPGWAFAIAIALGIVLGHVLWGPARGILAPLPRRLARPRASRMQVSPGAVLSLLATIVAGIVFVMMVLETVELGEGRDPITNRVRAAVRAYPGISYALAVLLGLVLGHLFWP